MSKPSTVQGLFYSAAPQRTMCLMAPSLIAFLGLFAAVIASSTEARGKGEAATCLASDGRRNVTAGWDPGDEAAVANDRKLKVATKRFFHPNAATAFNRKTLNKGKNNAIATGSLIPDYNLQLKHPVQKSCAWQSYVTGHFWNAAFPDGQAIYQALVLRHVDENRIFRIHGTFPTKAVRSFSFRTNIQEVEQVGLLVSTLKDYEIVPDAGSGRNPFQTGSAEPTGSYTINFTPRGNQNLMNEVALCPKDMPDDDCKDITVVVVMRLYLSDPDMPAADTDTNTRADHSDLRLFGYEAPPEVEIRTFKKNDVEKWQALPACDQTRPTAVTQRMRQYFSEAIPAFPNPPRYNRKDGFEMYLGIKTLGDVLYPNLDAGSLMAFAWQTPIDVPDERIVAKVMGVLPVTARNHVVEPRIANWADYEARYVSFSTIALVQGGPLCQTLDDASFIRFYGNNPGWNEHRTFSIVAAEDPNRTCGLYNANEDLFLRTTVRGAPQDYWAIVYRQLHPKTNRDNQPDRSNAYAHLACSSMMAGQACSSNSSFLEQIQGDHYPRVEWFTCSKDGKLTSIAERPTWYK